jgi:hypothetical protein
MPVVEDDGDSTSSAQAPGAGVDPAKYPRKWTPGKVVEKRIRQAVNDAFCGHKLGTDHSVTVLMPRVFWGKGDPANNFDKPNGNPGKGRFKSDYDSFWRKRKALAKDQYLVPVGQSELDTTASRIRDFCGLVATAGPGENKPVGVGYWIADRFTDEDKDQFGRLTIQSCDICGCTR